MKAAICQPQMGKEALLGLLSAKSEGERAFVFDAAREARHRAFGNKVFLYGFLYLSTHCRNDCAFCQYRRSNPSLDRSRKPLGEMLEAAGRLAADGIHLLDLTLGEDLIMWSPPDSIGCWSWYQPSRKPPGCRSWCLRACFRRNSSYGSVSRGGLVRLLSGDAQPGFVHAFASGAGL